MIKRPAPAAAITALITALAVGGVAAQQARTRPAGYLAAGAFDLKAVLPAAPQVGDARAEADRAIFRATRRMVGTPRYALATNDVKLTPADLGRDYSCALGVQLTPQNAPRTIALIGRAAVDTGRQTNAVKNFYRRERPYHYDPGPVCEPISELADSYDYPSGHTTLGWTWALILARLAPDRATPILARGRAYGESRAVCGAHNWSAVENAFVSASATMDVVGAIPEFQANLAGAKAEMDALRADPAAPRPQGCEAEAALVSQPVLAGTAAASAR